ncbi:MAG: hypothetical protein ACO3JL_12080 [Myxococcota bacterium]
MRGVLAGDGGELSQEASVLMCPRCRSEYRSGITWCASCEKDLVHPDDLESKEARERNPRQELEAVPKVFFPARSLDAAREVERELRGHGILAYVHAEEVEGGVLTVGLLQYAVAFAQDDADAVRAVLEQRNVTALDREGLGALALAPVDLEAAEVTCPACGFTGALDDNSACADCGLVLGVEG